MVANRRRYVKSDRKIATNCSAYLVPMIFKTFEEIPLYKGCFCGDDNFPELNEHIFILCKFDGTIDQKEFEGILMDSDNFVTLYYPDDYSTMFVYEVPDILRNDYNLIIQGKYSETTEMFKRKVCFFWGFDKNSKYYQILYKSPERKKILEEELNVKIHKDAELGTLFNKQRDWFNDSHKETKIGGFSEGRKDG